MAGDPLGKREILRWCKMALPAWATPRSRSWHRRALRCYLSRQRNSTRLCVASIAQHRLKDYGIPFDSLAPGMIVSAQRKNSCTNKTTAIESKIGDHQRIGMKKKSCRD